MVGTKKRPGSVGPHALSGEAGRVKESIHKRMETQKDGLDFITGAVDEYNKRRNQANKPIALGINTSSSSSAAQISIDVEETAEESANRIHNAEIKARKALNDALVALFDLEKAKKTRDVEEDINKPMPNLVAVTLVSCPSVHSTDRRSGDRDKHLFAHSNNTAVSPALLAMFHVMM